MRRTTIAQFVADKSFEEYESDRMLRGAVERHLEIIGEAARHVSTDYQSAHPQIAWKGIMAQRHVLAHDYGEIKHELIWRVATEHVLELIADLEPLVPDVAAEGEGDEA